MKIEKYEDINGRVGQIMFRSYNNIAKSENNAIFSTLSKVINNDFTAKWTLRRQRKIVYIEGEEGLTTKTLLSFGFDCKQLIAVNNNYEICKELKKIYPWLDVYCDNLGEFLEHQNRHYIFALYADFCSTWIGNTNTEIYPKKDIFKFLQYSAINMLVLCITICLRDSRVKGKDAFKKTIDNIMCDIYHICEQTGFDIVNDKIELGAEKEKIPSLAKYSRTMVFIPLLLMKNGSSFT